MSEEQKQKGEGEAKVVPTTRNQSKMATLIEQANTAAKRLEAANEKQAELNEQAEELKARGILGGQADAGTQKEEKKEVSAADYADLVLKGSLPRE